MHNCLQIVEIQERICEEIDLSSNSKDSLVSLALSCRSFFRPAIASLWRRLTDLSPLIRCTPEDLWKRDNNGRLSLQRDIRDTDWDRPFFYSKYVKELVIKQSLGMWHAGNFASTRDMLGVAGAFISSLSGLQPPLLRNIQMLDMTYRQLEFNVIVASLGPHLSSLTLRSHTHFSMYHPLPAIIAKCPNIKTMNIGDMKPRFRPTVAEDPALAAAYRSYRLLENLTISTLTVQAATVLSQLPRLRALAVMKCSLPSTVSGSVDELPDTGFLSLQSLTVRVEDSDSSFPNLFAMMKHSPLSILEIHLANPDLDYMAVVNNLFSFFTPSHFARSLTEFVLAVDIPSKQGHDRGVNQTGSNDCSVSAFERLSPFSYLETVMLVTPFPIVLGHAHLASIAHKWPRLTDLDLSHHSGPRDAPRMPLQSLALLTDCPNLNYISICVDATAVPAVQTKEVMKKPKSAFTHTTSLRIRLHSSPIEDPRSVTAFLALSFWTVMICPPVDDLEVGDVDDFRENQWPEEDKDGIKVGGWNKVHEVLGDIILLREGYKRSKESKEIWIEPSSDGM